MDWAILTLVFGLLLTTVVLALLLSFSLHTLRTDAHLHFRELVATRHQYSRIISEQRAEIRALTESALRSEGKVYMPPFAPTPTDDSKLIPSPSAFRMRPNPPKVTFKEGKR